MPLNKIVYITNTRLPTEKAHGLATIKLCEAFAKLGYEVDITCPFLWRMPQCDIFNYYDVKKNFNIRKIFTIDLLSLGIWKPLAFFVQIFSFSICATFYLLYKYRKNFNNIIFFSHDYIPLYFLTFFSEKVFYDIHHFPGKNILYKRVMGKSFGFAVQTRWKIKALRDDFGISPEKIVYWPNGTDVDEFRLNISRPEARKKINLPDDKKIVLYTGQLFDWKGVDTLLRSAKFLPSGILVYIVGGSAEDAARLKKKIPEAADKKIIFIGFQSHHSMPLWLRTADVLVLPNTGKQKVSLYYTSPMKLFEYMASGTPIAASKIPSITEILDEKNAVLAEPDNPASFADKINYILNNSEKSAILGKQAREDVKKYTWEERARRICKKFITK
jgi:glycosyltransferase involved in cell wall biosynthesis